MYLDLNNTIVDDAGPSYVKLVLSNFQEIHIDIQLLGVMVEVWQRTEGRPITDYFTEVAAK